MDPWKRKPHFITFSSSLYISKNKTLSRHSRENRQTWSFSFFVSFCFFSSVSFSFHLFQSVLFLPLMELECGCKYNVCVIVYFVPVGFFWWKCNVVCLSVGYFLVLIICYGIWIHCFPFLWFSYGMKAFLTWNKWKLFFPWKNNWWKLL